MRQEIDPKDLILGQGLLAYRDDFGVYLRLIQGKEEQIIDLNEMQAWKLLQILHADLERLAEAVYQGPTAFTEPNYRCLAQDEGCTNRVTASTWQRVGERLAGQSPHSSLCMSRDISRAYPASAYPGFTRGYCYVPSAMVARGTDNA